MKEPWQWQEGEIQALIREQRGEDLTLEYKRADALGKNDERKREITKDVSAMANSAGGVIIYGIDEQKNTNGPVKLDVGVDRNVIPTEWLEQVIDSGIHRRVSFRVNPVEMSATGECVYIVAVPQSNWAPHMAADHRYYKRVGTTTATMEEYEVRDVARRSESPDLSIDLRVRGSSAGTIQVHPRITNGSAEPVLYASIRLYAEAPLDIQANAEWSSLDGSEMIWNNRDRLQFRGVRRNWSVPMCHPILEGEYYDLPHLNVGGLSRAWNEVSRSISDGRSGPPKRPLSSAG